MSLKFKALGLAALAATTIAGLTAMSASATVSGHFVSEAPDGHTIVNQVSSFPSNHGFTIRIDEAGEPITCEQFSAFGTASSSTLTEVEGVTEAKGCRTGGMGAEILVHPNGCKGKAWSNSSGAVTGGVVCPAGKNLEFTHPNCTIVAPPQSGITGLTPTTIVANNKHAITVDVNVKYTVHYEQGFCIFLGTKHTATIVGSTIIYGQNTFGERVGITST
jgi:hypothetical protein